MLSRLPDKYEIPKFHGPSEKREFDDNYLLMFKPTSKGRVLVETEDGPLELKDRRDIPLLFKRRYNWTYSRLKEWECIFRFFTDEELFNLKQVHVIEFGTYKLFWTPHTYKMRLESRGPQSSKFLINTASWCNADYLARNIDDLRTIVDKILILNRSIPFNMTSPASTTKDLILRTDNSNFSLFNKLPLEATRFLHSCYIGPRMESRYLGTIEGVETMDLKRAYLRALGRCPSLSPDYILKVVKDAPFDPEAHPGSGYEIVAEVPKSYDKFAPLPNRWQGKTPYPQGDLKPIKVSKPYIDLLNKRGDIPYTILSSYQIIPNGKPYYPYQKLAQVLENFQDKYKEFFLPLNLKALHYPIQGHMLHIHRNIDFSNGHIWYEAGQDYNPAYASAIQAMVAFEIWEMSQVYNTEQIRVDALTGYNLPDKSNFTKSTSGLMTTYTPGLKDKPGSSVYRDLIHEWRDYPAIQLSIPMRVGMNDAWYAPHMIGKITNLHQTLPPSRGNRDNGVPLDIKRIGELLDKRIEIPIPDIPTEDFVEPADKREVPYWLEDYLTLYPQMRI